MTEFNNNEQAPQYKTTGKISANRAGGECIKFSFNLGFFQLRCVVNVPGENEEEAPVYIKFHVRKPETSKTQTSAEKHVVRSRKNVSRELDTEVEYHENARREEAEIAADGQY